MMLDIKAFSPTIILILIANLIFGVAVGYYLAFMPLLLEDRGISPSFIGLHAAASSVAVFVLAPLYGKIHARLGYRNSLILGDIIYMIAIILAGFVEGFWAWTILRLLAGFGIALGWLACESWLNQLAPPHARGLIMGVYTSLFLGGMVLGPLFVPLVGLGVPLPFWIIAAMAAVGILFMLFTKEQASHAQEPFSLASLKNVIHKMPRLFAAMIVIGITQGVGLTMMGFHAVSLGEDLLTASLRLSFFLIGGLIFQLPLGIFSDRFGRVKLFIVTALISFVMIIAMLPLERYLAQNGLEIIYLFYLSFYGGVVFGLYTLSLALVGDRFSSTKYMAAANGLMILCWEMGAMSGGTIAGVAMDVTGPNGFFYVQMIALFIVLMIGFWRTRRPSVATGG